MKNYFALFISSIFILLIASCQNEKNTDVKQIGLVISDTTRIVSLNGALTEILCKAGFEKNIVGVDITSTFPPSMMALPKAGYTRNLQSEGIASLKPHLVFGLEKEVKPEIKQQLEASGIQVVLINRDFTLEGTFALNELMGDTLNQPQLAQSLNDSITDKIKEIKTFDSKPKVLFIYARGTNTLMTAGDDTPIQHFIQLAGAENCVSGFNDYKQLTPESLVAANPDVILMFDSGFESINGYDGIWTLPGIMETNAGKNKRVITMQGEYISCFGPRLGHAIVDFNKLLFSNVD